jgi:glyoxylase-like metal-dependent hydrolase (beta-lactamase superfamily II)
VTVEQVVPGVWRAGTRYVNWYVVDGGHAGLTLVDAGLPRYREQLAPSLAAIGRTPADIRAVMLTHGHIDHIGMAATLAEAGATIHLHPADVPLARAPRTNTSQCPAWHYLKWPASWAFAAHAVAQGVTKPDRMPDAVPLVDGATAAVPGSPVVTHVPGHTDGSCVLEFRDHGVVFVGDLLCTVSPVTWRPDEPQLQTRGSNKNSDVAMQSLDRLAGVASGVVLPGHGGPWHDGVEAAVTTARRIGCR